MPRTARATVGGLVYHVLNRGNNRQRVFRKPADFDAFVQLLIEGRKRAEVEVLGYCLMSNHFHLVLIPRRDGDLAKFMSWVTNTHVKRYRAHYRSTSGHLYQGRFKSFVVQEDGHLLTLLRYVEANPVRADVVPRAEEWRWSSLGCGAKIRSELLSDWPVNRPGNWAALVNRGMEESQVQALRESIVRDRPYGDVKWALRMAKRLGMEHALRKRGRPKREKR